MRIGNGGGGGGGALSVKVICLEPVMPLIVHAFCLSFSLLNEEVVRAEPGDCKRLCEQVCSIV